MLVATWTVSSDACTEILIPPPFASSEKLRSVIPSSREVTTDSDLLLLG